MRRFIFDVDGTLTPSRQQMNSEFASWFQSFASREKVYLVTGSDRNKTVDQVPQAVYNSCQRVYQCSGGDVWEKDNNVRSSGNIYLTDVMRSCLESMVESSEFKHKTYNHIDERPGLINFSIVGRGCSLKERSLYKQWDNKTCEREALAKRLRVEFPTFNFMIAGETGIDITAKGVDKSRVLDDFSEEDHIYFFGDCCLLGGNDYEISRAVNQRENSKSYDVEGWEYTWKKLKELE